jgi:hypothetical protein
MQITVDLPDQLIQHFNQNRLAREILDCDRNTLSQILVQPTNQNQ